MNKIFDMQDRSLSGGKESDFNPKVDTNLTTKQVLNMVDLESYQIDILNRMKVNQEVIFSGWIWVKRTA